jgi:hypothetical protein
MARLHPTPAKDAGNGPKQGFKCPRRRFRMLDDEKPCPTFKLVLQPISMGKSEACMGLYDSRRNFGFGKNLGFAGKNALRERDGHGHFVTVAAHDKRFARFADHLKIQGIQDARQITTRHVEDYAR